MATVSPVYVDVDTLTGGSGSAVFTVTPHAVGKTKVGLIDLQGRYAIVPVTVTPTSPPTPTPTATAAPTATPTAAPTAPPTATPTAAPTPTPTVPPTPPPDGHIVFNPASPETIHPGTTYPGTIQVSEGNYSQGFQVTGCPFTTTYSVCARDNNFGYKCTSTDLNDSGTITIALDPGVLGQSLTQTITFNGGAIQEDCQFTVSDIVGNTATYDISAFP